MIKISILTINYNNASGLQRTLESINNQLIPLGFTYELNVVDGFSSDNSISILNSYSTIIKNLICEKDDGIYDAMNKGIELSNGEYLLFLNSGDYFSTSNAFTIINEALKNIENNKTMLFWPVTNISNNGESWLYPKKSTSDFSKWLKHNEPNHQAMLFPIDFYSKNKYNLNYKIAADRDYKRRCIKDYDFFFIKDSITDFSIGGVSTSYLNFKKYRILLKDNYMFYNTHYLGINRIYLKLIDTVKFSVKLLISILFKKYYSRIIQMMKGYK